MTSSDQSSEASRHRRLISQVLVAGLIAVAYSEPVVPVGEAFDRHGVDIRSLAWLLIYGATVLRFFIGNIVHLENSDLTGSDAAFRWFFDISFVIAECVVLIFAGAVTTLHASAVAHVSFTDYLLVLYILDVTWLVLMQAMSALGKPTRLPKIFGSMVRRADMAPFEWAIVNVILGLSMWGLDLVGHPSHIPDWKLYLLVAINIAVFIYDVGTIAYGIREKNEGSPPPASA